MRSHPRNQMGAGSSLDLDTTVVGLQGRAVGNTPPAPGQVLGWNGSIWTPTTVPLEPGQGVQAGLGLGIDSTTTPETIYLMVPVSIAMGGTGQTNAADALTALGGVNASYVANAVAPYLPLSGGTVTGSLTVEGSLQADNGRVISSDNDQPSFTMWDPAIDTGGGLYSEVGTGRICFGIMDADGNATEILGGMDRAGSLTVEGCLQSFHGRVISGDNNQPSFTMWDPEIGLGGGLYSEVGTGRICFGIMDADGNTTQLLGGMDRSGSLTVEGSLQSFHGRVISGDTNQPSFTMWDPGIGLAGGLYSETGTGRICFGIMDADGNTTQFLGGMDRSGNFFVTGAGWQPGGGNWSDSSDLRIKDVASEYSAGLAEICRLQPVRYRFRGNDGEAHRSVTDRDFVGLVADDVMEPFPECVSLVEGEIDGEKVEDMKALNTGPLLYALINAVKELSARVEALEVR